MPLAPDSLIIFRAEVIGRLYGCLVPKLIADAVRCRVARFRDKVRYYSSDTALRECNDILALAEGYPEPRWYMFADMLNEACVSGIITAKDIKHGGAWVERCKVVKAEFDSENR
jgi:hypothetical protein